MSDTPKTTHREFWIYDIADCEHPLLVKKKLPTEPCDFPNAYKNKMKYFDLVVNRWKSYREEIHVIEYAAVEELLAENKRLREALAFVNEEFVPDQGPTVYVGRVDLEKARRALEGK